VERIFSVAGQFFDDLRRSLGDDVLEEIMWAAINIDFFIRRAFCTFFG
jgi:hypothetical protein